MCAFSSPPSPPPLPPEPVKERETKAEKAAQDKKKRLAKRKGGREFLASGQGFRGLQNTLLGSDPDQL